MTRFAARQLVAIAVLPFTVAVLIPMWIARGYGVSLRAGAGMFERSLQALGVCALAVGLFLFAASLFRFVTEGRGTLAPWDPPRRLVIRGPYRYVRNPMISGVVFVLFGEALLWLSTPHGIWALSFFAMNCVHIPLVEEPDLAARFGEPYRDYCRHVPRLIPRLKPWSPAEAGHYRDSAR